MKIRDSNLPAARAADLTFLLGAIERGYSLTALPPIDQQRRNAKDQKGVSLEHGFSRRMVG
jgi:hypothetical protein